MLLSSATLNLISAVNYDNVIKIINHTLSSFNYIYSYMDNNTNAYIAKYLDDIDVLDIKVKLEFINNWLYEHNDIEEKETNEDIVLINKKKIKKSDNFNLIFMKIKEIIAVINYDIITIENKIKKYSNSWKSYIYNLNLSNDIIKLEKNMKILNSRIHLINII
jgi:hypothetical protein